MIDAVNREDASLTGRFTLALAERYRIERRLGAGGMAIVYLATDLRHDRPVALKVLRPDLAAAIGAERFLQEIKTTANLQHPHIVSLHDSGEVDGVVYYVMPFVEGEGLRERLQRERQLPIADAVLIATQVASALDYAHRHGVIHRDIKPENILLHDGSAVVADFGIALAVQSAAGLRLTQTGLSLGTPQYMAPEQAMGERTIDGRADIYALAAVLYEMLIGEAPFTGPTVQAIVARTMSEDPRSLVAQRRAIPIALDSAVLRGLEKLPADRFATAGDFASAINTLGLESHPRQSPTSRTPWRTVAVALGACCAMLAVATTVAVARARRATPLPLVTSHISPAHDAPSELREIALSPDGLTLAYVSSAADGGRIWLRKLSDDTARPLRDTEGARTPFWAPDGSGIGFFAAGQLRVVSLGSGAVRSLATAPDPAGGSWSRDGTIIYSPFYRRLWRVPAGGGTPAHAITDGDDSTPGSREPHMLPDGHRFTFWHSVTNDAWIGDLSTGIARKIADNVTSPVYVEPGVLLFFQPGTQVSLEQPAPLMAQRFDLDAMKLLGEPVVVSPRVDRPGQLAILSATRDFLAMREAPVREGTDARGEGSASAHGSIYWLDRATGRRNEPVRGTGGGWAFRASHGGQVFALAGPGLSIYDAQRDVAVRHPARLAIGGWPQAWSPDDRDIAVNAGARIMIVRVDGSSPERFFEQPGAGGWPTPLDWSADNKIYFLSAASEAVAQFQLWRHDLATGKDEHVTTGSGNVFDARLSPDGKWIAWESDASGRREIHLGPIAGSSTPMRASKLGGGSPRWRRDGRELFFMGGDGRIMAVSVQLGATPVIGEPKRVADLVTHPEPMGIDPYLDTRFEPTPAGDRFLVQTPLGAGTHELTLVQGWQRKLGIAQ
jgi:serine/threonine-protein kinase